MRIAPEVAKYVGMTQAELDTALSSEKTCPLCIETGTDERPHSKQDCYMVLSVWADRSNPNNWL